MSALDLALEAARIQRLLYQERRYSGEVISGDFSGSVDGKWVRLDEGGAGIVKYNGKEYKTKMLGTTPLPAGASVELTYAHGTYFSNY